MASIEQRGESWRVVWRYEGQKQYTTWPEGRLAEQARDIAEAHRHKISADGVYEAMGVLDEEDPAEATGLTLRQWAVEWLPSKTRITPGTRGRYEQQLRDHIYPAFGDTALTAITAVMVGTWLNQLSQIMGSPKTVTRYYSLLHTLLEAAARHGHITLNPCRATDFVRDQRADDDTGEHHAVYLTPSQFELLRAEFTGRWHPLLDCFVETGLRWGEATALAAKHLVAPTATTGPRLHVWRAWKEANGKRYLGATKGRSKRTLPIGDDLYKTLLGLVDGGDGNTLIFRTGAGEALDYDHMYDHVWKPALLRAQRCATHPPANRGEPLTDGRGRCRDFGGARGDGVPCGSRVVPGTNRCAQHFGPPPGAVSTCDCSDVLRSAPSWHDLRHTHAAWLFSDPRMTPLAISRRLGHQQLATTSEIYGDLMPEAEELAVNAVADARKAGRGED
jgi:integrase